MIRETQTAPVSDVDPFCREFFEDPFAAHEELREAGPVVRLSRYGVLAVARYAEVHTVLNDWQTFCSSRGAGLTDFAKEAPWRPPSLVLEVDPPLHNRTRRVLNRVLSAATIQGLRERFAQEADALVDDLVERGGFDAITDLAEAYPLKVFPDAMGMPRDNRHFLLPYGNMVFNAFGPRNEFFEQAVADAEPVLSWLRRQMQRDAFAPGGFGAAIHAASDTGELTPEEAPIVARSLLSAGSTRRSAAWVPRSIVWHASPSSSLVCERSLRWPVPRSRKRCGMRARCRLFSGPLPVQPRSAACRSTRARRC